jgi:hypothetical protein
MVTARARFLAKKFEEKYGVIGKVAGRYIAAGLSVEFAHPTRYGPIHLVARGCGGKLFAIEIVDKLEKLTLDTIKTLAEKAKLVRAKPVLVLYFSNIRLSDELYKFCVENGVKIRVIRPSEETVV